MNRLKTILTIFLVISVLTGRADDEKNLKILAQSEGSITFVVDENLKDVEQSFFTYDGESLAERLIVDENVKYEAHHIIASSFADENKLVYHGPDAFFRSIVGAYAQHKSVTLSPDMIWLLISQGFARYVNAHAEALRSQLVDHEGQVSLVVESDVDVLSEKVDWPKLISGFTSQIERYTQGDIGKTITANFSTTGLTERVASQITLMDAMKSYFEYVVVYIACGIPSITLQGTPDDWRKVMDKTRRLSAYGLEEWTKSLDNVLRQILATAEGRPNPLFWKSMVKQYRPDEMQGGACDMRKPTELDGWLLKLFPDENGKTLDKVAHTKEMESEMVRTPFKYQMIDPETGMLLNEWPMELWAGFIGAQEDRETNLVTPKIGWMVRVTETDQETLKQMKKLNERGEINLRVKEVPEVLKKLKRIQSLKLEFTGDVTLPEWFYDIKFEQLDIRGKMSEKTREMMKKRWPKASIYEYLGKYRLQLDNKEYKDIKVDLIKMN
jgi:hypothetical protein